MIGNTGKQNVISTGNETLDRFMGGGFLNSSLNIFERQGPSSRLLDSIWNKSFAASTLSIRKDCLIYVNFNSTTELEKQSLLTSLPTPRKVKADILYKDIRSKSAQVKIAWRYTNRPISSPSDTIARVDQVDFGLSLAKETEDNDLEQRLFIINRSAKDDIEVVLSKIRETILVIKQSKANFSIILKDVLHPFSLKMIDRNFLNLLYGIRCLSRSVDKGAVLISYDCELFDNHDNIKQQLYNFADCVVSFYSYETGENRLTGYKDIDGTLEYVKVPKINSYGFHFQRDLSDWGYRITRNHRFFVVDELSLPPCESEDDDIKSKGGQMTTRMTSIESTTRPLELVGPLEEFREVAKDVLAKKL